jgi:FkbM family methyltransferase
MHHFRLLVSRVKRAIGQRVKTWRLERALDVAPRTDLTAIGTSYGGWSIPTDVLKADSVCYLAGVGEDASFDLGLIERYGCTVHAFDPVPEAARYAATVTGREPRWHFWPIGLWREDGTLRFYEHAQPGFVSRSLTNMHDTGAYMEADVRAIDSLMAELGHDRVDLLKLSVEGAEYEILADVLAKRIPVEVVCVEFSQPAPLAPVLRQVQALRAAGYELLAAALVPSAWRLIFLMASSNRPSISSATTGAA